MAAHDSDVNSSRILTFPPLWTQVSFDGRHSNLLSSHSLDGTPLTPISLSHYHDYYTGKSFMGTHLNEPLLLSLGAAHRCGKNEFHYRLKRALHSSYLPIMKSIRRS